MAAVAPGASYPPAGSVWSSPQRVNSRGRKPPKRSLRGSSSRITWETHSFHSFPNERCDHLLANERTYKGGRLILQAIALDLEKPRLLRPGECLVPRDLGVLDQLIAVSLVSAGVGHHRPI